MSGLIDTLLNQIRVNHVWLFLTERCNLSCDYCFFGDRDGRTTISMDKVRTFFAVLPRNVSYDIVISGGEPLAEWRRTREVITFVSSYSPGSRLMVQTNGVLLDKTKTAFLRAHRVGLEFGIDGKLATNERHRKGSNGLVYARVLNNINGAVAAGICTSATMTVHPAEAVRMLENYSSLSEIGINSLEVHPAFMAPWSKRQASEFLYGYRKILAQDIKSGRRRVSPYYSRNIPPLLDMVVQPDGRVLPSWTYLIFPKALRESFYLMEIDAVAKSVELRTAAIVAYMRDISHFFSRPRTYRELSNFNARRILVLKNDVHWSRAFHVYEQLCRQVQKLDWRLSSASSRPVIF